MNILLWTLQVLLALWNLIGGAFVLMNYEKIGSTWALGVFPKPAWMAFALLQILFAVALVVPKFSVAGAVGLTVVSLLGLAIYTQYAGFPGMLWGVLPALLLVFVTYGRLALKPL